MPFASARPRSRAALVRIALAAALLFVVTGRAGAQQAAPHPAVPEGQLRIPDSLHSQVIELRDGSSLIGRIAEVRGDTVVFATAVTRVLVPRTAIMSVREIGNPVVAPNGEVWLPDPGVTRLLFAPTGRMLAQGDGYFSNAYLFFLGFFQAPSDRVTIGGGMSIIPSDDFLENNAYYLMPKVGLVQSERVNVAVGGLVGVVPGADGASGGIAYGVATLGARESNLTLGAGYGFNDDEVMDTPLLMLGLYQRLSRRTAFVSENYVLPGEDPIVFSYGLRFFGEKLSVDFAFLNASDSGIMPGIPYIAFAKHF
jgi:hypothetical protein